MNRIIFSALLIGLSAMSMFSQNETVILYNSEAVAVELSSDGKIIAFEGAVPGYMSDYNVVKKNITSTSNKHGNVASRSVADFKNAGYAVLSTERTMLDYKPGFATLSQPILLELNKVASNLKTNPNARLLVTSHKKDDTPGSIKLADNRLKSVLTYLKIKGVSESSILTEVQLSHANSDKVALNYLN